jgi:hypothetical protein
VPTGWPEHWPIALHAVVIVTLAATFAADAQQVKAVARTTKIASPWRWRADVL